MEHGLLRISAFDRWFIVNAENPQLAWSGAKWVPHFNGLPASSFQICNFDSPEDARRYAGEHGLEVDLVH